MTTSNSHSIALDFLTACRDTGWLVTVRRATPSAPLTIVTINKNFTPGDNDAYVACDVDAYDLLSFLPGSSGSVWGTTGDGVGGHVGREKGYYTLNKSGVNKRVLSRIITEIAKAQSPDNNV